MCTICPGWLNSEAARAAVPLLAGQLKSARNTTKYSAILTLLERAKAPNSVALLVQVVLDGFLCGYLHDQYSIIHTLDKINPKWGATAAGKGLVEEVIRRFDGDEWNLPAHNTWVDHEKWAIERLLGKIGGCGAIEPLISFVRSAGFADEAVKSIRLILEREIGSLMDSELRLIVGLDQHISYSYNTNPGDDSNSTAFDMIDCSALHAIANRELLRRRIGCSG